AVLATTAVVVGLGGGIALVASRIATTDSQVKALAISMRDLSSTGRQAASAMQALSVDVADNSSFTRDDGYQAARIITDHRKLAQTVQRDLVGLSASVAQVMGSTMTEAAGALAAAFEDGYQGIVKLDQGWNILTADEASTIRTLSEQGKQLEAQKIALAALNRQFSTLATEGLSEFEKAANRAAAAWQGVIDAVASSGIAQTTWTGAKRAATVTADAAAGFGNWLTQDTTAQTVAALDAAILSARRELADLVASRTDSPVVQQLVDPQIDALQSKIDRLTGEIDRLREKGQKTTQEAEAAIGTLLGAQARNAAILPDAALQAAAKMLAALENDQ
ncbi:hypothetical protein ACFQPI_20970, partial [Insolitispirillum peregrinum]|uniref:hypothetical protein n=1 Tax=Insolitispirillum peregrinum TaxID=80876 RepID=UPI00360BA325